MKKVKKYYPAILTLVGAVGTIGTSVLAVKATPKALRLIRQDSKMNHEGDADAYSMKEAIQSSWKCYIPTILVGSTTVACIFGANYLSVKNQASLASAYALLNESYKQYKDSAKSILGEDAHKQIKAKMATDMYISSDGFNLYERRYDESDVCLFYDFNSSRYFRSTLAAVINAQYHTNRNFQLRGCVYLDEYYDFLGLESIEGGDILGWCAEDMDGYVWLDFNNEYTVLEDGMECYIIESSFEPKVVDEYY